MSRLLFVLLLLLAAGLVSTPWLFSTYIVSVLMAVLMFVTLTLAWSVFSGYTRYLSFATVAFFGIGAYTTAVLGNRCPCPS